MLDASCNPANPQLNVHLGVEDSLSIAREQQVDQPPALVTSMADSHAQTSSRPPYPRHNRPRPVRDL